MAMMHVAVVVGVLGMTSGPRGAQVRAVQEPVAQRAPASATNSWLVPPGKDPFGNIVFSSPRQDRRIQGRPEMRELNRASGTQPRIVCGMTVVTVTPDADPKMVMSPKPDSKVEYKTRVISPRICRE
jgi:hypothetical protein